MTLSETQTAAVTNSGASTCSPVHPCRLPMPKTVTPAQIEDDPQAHEDQHVHAVYDKIASHFSSTRYKVSFSISEVSHFKFLSLNCKAMANYCPLPVYAVRWFCWSRRWNRERQISAIAA
jgi:hypothetical protein